LVAQLNRELLLLLRRFSHTNTVTWSVAMVVRCRCRGR
jgi:hypothetical protein